MFITNMHSEYLGFFRIDTAQGNCTFKNNLALYSNDYLHTKKKQKSLYFVYTYKNFLKQYPTT